MPWQIFCLLEMELLHVLAQSWIALYIFYFDDGTGFGNILNILHTVSSEPESIFNLFIQFCFEQFVIVYSFAWSMPSMGGSRADGRQSPAVQNWSKMNFIGVHKRTAALVFLIIFFLNKHRNAKKIPEKLVEMLWFFNQENLWSVDPINSSLVFLMFNNANISVLLTFSQKERQTHHPCMSINDEVTILNY